MTSDTVYVVVSAEKAAAELKGLVDAGMISRANQLSGYLQGFYDQLASFCTQHGGHLSQHLYERSIMEIPLSCAHDLPQYVDQFEKQFGNKLAMGFGFTLQEAAQAMEYSLNSGEPELFEGGRDYPYFKEDAPKFNDKEAAKELGPNQYDPTNPPSPDPDDHPHPKGQVDEEPAPARPNAQDSAKLQQELLASMLPAAPPAPPPVDPQAAATQAVAPPDEQQKAEAEASDTEHQKFIGKLADSLHQVRSYLPQIMQLADHNPKAFSQAMGVISKLVGAVKHHKAIKAEAFQRYDNLVKRLNEQLEKKAIFPVGTVLRGKRKILANGKASWRSVRSGQIMDAQGNPTGANKQPKPTSKENEGTEE